MQYDVLQLAGLPPKTRDELYDFIVTEMEALALKHPHSDRVGGAKAPTSHRTARTVTTMLQPQ